MTMLSPTAPPPTTPAASAPTTSSGGDEVTDGTPSTSSTSGPRKCFVGGLAWSTSSDSLYDHFIQYGAIEEAVVISDRFTNRSRGYGFITFEEPAAAALATQHPNPIIDSRKA
eukprot:224414_1